MPSFDERDLSYTAGLFDGEGCVYIGLRSGYHTLSVSITNTDKPVLDWTASMFGGTVRCRSNGKYRPVFVWDMAGPGAAVFLSTISPWLRIKAQQAWMAREYDVQRDNSYGTRVTSEEFALREGFRLALREAKRP